MTPIKPLNIYPKINKTTNAYSNHCDKGGQFSERKVITKEFCE